MPKNVVFMYHDDEQEWKERLCGHLSGLRREGEIAIIEQADPRNMPHLDIILVLLSPSLLASDTLVNAVNYAISQQDRHQRIISILCRAVNVKEDLPRLGKMQGLPRGENPKPLQAWQHQDEILVQITQEIREVVRDLSK